MTFHYPPLEGLQQLAEELKCFGFPEFTDAFIAKVKLEIPCAIEFAKKPFDWNGLEGSTTYRKRVMARARREKQRAILDSELEEADDDDARRQATLKVNDKLRASKMYEKWDEDPAERARRIYLWWLTYVLSDNSRILHISQALRLVVLAQPSSASVERVFSQLQYIRRICGDQLLEDLLNLRLIIRCNAGLEEDFN